MFKWKDESSASSSYISQNSSVLRNNNFPVIFCFLELLSCFQHLFGHISTVGQPTSFPE